MSKKDKLIKKFLSRPRSLKYSELEQVLLSFEFVKIPAKGSHVKFSHELLRYDLVIPVHNRECKDLYKGLAAKCVGEVISKTGL